MNAHTYIYDPIWCNINAYACTQSTLSQKQYFCHLPILFDKHFHADNNLAIIFILFIIFTFFDFGIQKKYIFFYYDWIDIA